MKLLVYLLLTAKVCATPMPESTAIIGPAKTAQALTMSTMNALSLMQDEDYQQDYDEAADKRQQKYARAVEVIGEVIDVADRFATASNNPKVMAVVGTI
jgi:hypothetical protein